MMEFPLKGLIYANHAEKVNGHNRWDLKQCTLFTEEETKKLSESLYIMERLFFNLERSFSVEDVFHELSKELCNLKSDDIYGIRRVDRLFRTYVIEFQMFLDHWVQYISDLKKKDEQYGAVYERLYRDVTSAAYDQCDEYVVAHVIRNYVVHGYDSINHCHIEENKNEVFIGRDNLFGINVSASARSIIQKQPDFINLMNVAEKSIVTLMGIQEQLMDYQVTNSVGEAALNLLNAKQRIDEAKIEADYWMLVDVVEPKIVMGSENHKLAKRDSINVVNKRVFWPTYLMVAGYTKKLWEQGYWTEIQEKYHI